MKHEKGDRVQWSSQANGSTTVKTGVVVEIVAPNQQPSEPHKALLRRKGGTSLLRGYESYVILGDNGETYFPYPNKLHPIIENE